MSLNLLYVNGIALKAYMRIQSANNVNSKNAIWETYVAPHTLHLEYAYLFHFLALFHFHSPFLLKGILPALTIRFIEK